MAVVSVPVLVHPPMRSRRAVACRRTRAALGLAVLGWLVVFVAAGLGTSNLPSGSDATVRVSGRTHVVQRGETLWSIAAGDGHDAGVDPRAAVRELASLNHIEGSDLRVGQVLVLP